MGKWHLGTAPRFRPQQRGFDEFGFLHEGQFYAPAPYRGLRSFLRKTGLPGGEGARVSEGDIT